MNKIQMAFEKKYHNSNLEKDAQGVYTNEFIRNAFHGFCSAWELIAEELPSLIDESPYADEYEKCISFGYNYCLEDIKQQLKDVSTKENKDGC